MLSIKTFGGPKCVYVLKKNLVDPVSHHFPFLSAAPMPEDYEQYFSFGQFAIELNELEEGLKDKLPQTDCRFRPDQR